MAKRLSGDSYEKRVRKLMCAFKRHAQNTTVGGSYTLDGGRENHIIGASGFPHQIDVSVSTPSDLLLVECKHWAKRVGPGAVLVLAARMIDISGAVSTRVHGSIVSTKPLTPGAEQLAKHFRIDLDTVVNRREYAVRIFNQVFVGIHERGHATDTIDADVIRRPTR